MNEFPTNQGKIIAIGGVSRSGKSELAKLLLSELSKHETEAVIISQDDHCFPAEKIPRIKNLPNWESPESMNWEKYHAAIQKFLNHNKIVILEGIFVFDDPEYAGKYAKEIVLSISKQTFLERRKKEKRWGREPFWFIEHVWDAYQKRPPKHSKDKLVLSGEKEYAITEVVGFVLKD
jgi:nicotinamide/nicotinate riboside kinase